MQFVVGAPIQVSAAPLGWVADFHDQDSGKTWSEPVIAWAVVAHNDEKDTVAVDTRVEPVVVDSEDGHTVPISTYLDDRDETVTYRGVRQSDTQVVTAATAA